MDDCISAYLQPNKKDTAWILDPFAGVGTTLVESYIHGINVVGFEINPYAALAARTKLEAVNVEPGTLQAQIAGFQRFMKTRCASANGKPRSTPPAGFSGRTQLFSPAVERKILFALDFINSIPISAVRDIFRVAFGSVMVNVSNYSYEPSLTRRLAVDKDEIGDAPVDEVVASKLMLMLEDVRWLQTQVPKLGHKPTAKVYDDSFFVAPNKLKRQSFIDLLVTSPPYLNNYHYPRNTRPQLHWLGFASGPGYGGARESESFGKFWQTVRDLDPIKLNFVLPALAEAVEDVRSRNAEKSAYGGPGWANYVASYFNDAYRFCKIVADFLKPGKGVAVIVLGNSIIQGVEIKTDYFFGKIAELCGLKFEETLLLREKRTGTSIIQSSVRVDRATKKTVLYESAIVLRK
ncbi:MAG: site-specific DNA-methyltransferase [Acidobacteria bacterium]|nr:site-specific DNA-methyltransferase [Acidobacteriota bacterium]